VEQSFVIGGRTPANVSWSAFRQEKPPVIRDDVGDHCAQIDRCNQRGGRMLSIVDLIEAGTVSRELAAYSLAAIGRGASFMVGALPGGAGKTTVMCALLNFVPKDAQLAPADGSAAIERGLKSPAPRRCYLCHEIGSGSYYAYLWGEELRAYFRLPEAGHIMATNLHADTYDQAYRQVCGTNGVSADALRRMNLMFFLSVGREGFRSRRRMATVWESDGREAHHPVFAGESPDRLDGSDLVSAEELAAARETIEAVLKSGARTIEEVRTFIVENRP
jgi:hypothetical protein